MWCFTYKLTVCMKVTVSVHVFTPNVTYDVCSSLASLIVSLFRRKNDDVQ